MYAIRLPELSVKCLVSHVRLRSIYSGSQASIGGSVAIGFAGDGETTAASTGAACAATGSSAATGTASPVSVSFIGSVLVPASASTAVSTSVVVTVALILAGGSSASAASSADLSKSCGGFGGDD